MLGFRHITLLMAIGFLLGGQTSWADAKPLSEAERYTCADLRSCIDILRRHDASEFDYTVLEAEFKRFGLAGRKALFDILESKAGSADTARMILALGPLNRIEMERADRIWNSSDAIRVAPFFETSSINNRDRWIGGLSHSDPKVREFSRRLYRMRKPLSAAPMTPVQQRAVLEDMLSSPLWWHSDLLGHIPASGNETLFAQLLLSGANATVRTTAYEGLYRESPAKAFNLLMDVMKRVETSQQAERLGEVLAKRHMKRADGFYARFAADVSGDTALPVQARAVGLQAWFLMMGVKTPTSPPVIPIEEFDAPRLQALSFLIEDKESNVATYAEVLDVLDIPLSLPALRLLLDKALLSKSLNDLTLLKAVSETPLEGRAMQAALSSRDLPVLKEAILQAQNKPVYRNNLSRLSRHPITSIRVASRAALSGQLKTFNSQAFRTAVNAENAKSTACQIRFFDRQDVMEQMPYFDTQPLKMSDEDPWLKTLNRKRLLAAHPASGGWLASYYSSQRSETIYFDNKTGEGTMIGRFAAPFAIVPDRQLPLGQTTQTFWVIDGEGHLGFRSFLYRLEKTSNGFKQQRIAEFPGQASDVAITRGGELIVSFSSSPDNPPHPPLRYSANGRMTLACVPSSTTQSLPTLN